MKSPLSIFSCKGLLMLLPVAMLILLAGCQSSTNNKDVMAPPDQQNTKNFVARLNVGDTVTITLNGLPEDILPMEKPIMDDGTITLEYIGRVAAAGKTSGQLADAIHDLYVPKYYTHLDVTVKTSNERVYFVSGEVKQPGRVLYTGEITVSRAITSAGDVTDFADRSDIVLIRSNGERFDLNLNRILSGKDPDPPVYPGDHIKVGRTAF